MKIKEALFDVGVAHNIKKEKKRLKRLEKNGYVDQRARLFDALNNADPNSEEYSQLLKNQELLERNCATQAAHGKVSADAKAYIASRFVLSAGILAYEENHVISTKAEQIVNKWRDK